MGQCSLTVALPILSACGLETCVLPSAVLSTHTGGFAGFTFRDLTDDMPAINAHWRKENIKFDAIYTGYLGSARQIDIVTDIMDTSGSDGCLRIVDPAMADGGKLYPSFDMEHVGGMKRLCAAADIVLPNITEASLMTGIEYREQYDEAYIRGLASALADLGAKTVVLTGVGYTADTTGVAVYRGGVLDHYAHRRIAKGCHGTGDVYASAFTGALMRGRGELDAARIAADFTVRCIENTQGHPEHWYGVMFETALPELMTLLKD